MWPSSERVLPSKPYFRATRGKSVTFLTPFQVKMDMVLAQPSVFHGVGLWDMTLWRWTFCIDIEDFAWEDGHDTYAYVSCPHLLTDVVSSSWPSAPLFISQAWSLSCETLWKDPNPYMANSKPQLGMCNATTLPAELTQPVYLTRLGVWVCAISKFKSKF